jgi:hypothetical protein
MDTVGSCVANAIAPRLSDGPGQPETAFVVWWSEFLATDPEIPGSIPIAIRFCEK